MKNIKIDDLINQLIKYKKEIIILSTDDDSRFFEAKKMVEKKVPNLSYLLVNRKFFNDFDSELREKLLNNYLMIRKGKESKEILVKNFNNNFNYFANLLLKSGYAHGIVSGCSQPTSNILRPAFQIIKAKKSEEPISSFILLKRPTDFDLFFADVSILPEPNEKQLGEIAIQTANSVKELFEINPVVAMLSFSTNGSGGNQNSVQKVQKATDFVKKHSNYDVIGEIQWDAAFRSDVLKNKFKDIKLKQMPNVFIFPDLNSANIGYKIAQSFGKLDAIGPILQNINLPVNDLSRGANAKEIFELVIITAIQYISAKND